MPTSVSMHSVRFLDKRDGKIKSKRIMIKPGAVDIEVRAHRAVSHIAGAKNIELIAIDGRPVNSPEVENEPEKLQPGVVIPTVEQIIEATKKQLVQYVKYLVEIPQFREYFSKVRLAWSVDHIREVILARLHPPAGSDPPTEPAEPAE